MVQDQRLTEPWKVFVPGSRPNARLNIVQAAKHQTKAFTTSSFVGSFEKQSGRRTICVPIMSLSKKLLKGTEPAHGSVYVFSIDVPWKRDSQSGLSIPLSQTCSSMGRPVSTVAGCSLCWSICLTQLAPLLCGHPSNFARTPFSSTSCFGCPGSLPPPSRPKLAVAERIKVHAVQCAYNHITAWPRTHACNKVLETNR